MIEFVSPFGPQFSSVHRSTSSVEICWLIFNVLIGIVRCIVLKNASWLKNELIVFGFCGGWWGCINIKSVDIITPSIVISSAPILIVFGIVMMVVVCSVESLVMVPTKIDPIVSRMIGLIGIFVS